MPCAAHLVTFAILSPPSAFLASTAELAIDDFQALIFQASATSRLPGFALFDIFGCDALRGRAFASNMEVAFGATH